MAASNDTRQIRPAFAPGVIAAMVLLGGVALIGSEWYLAIRFVVAILALIVAWFGIRAGQWWWSVAFLAVAVLWNPVFPLDLSGVWWAGAHILAAAAFIVAGGLIKTEAPDAS